MLRPESVRGLAVRSLLVSAAAFAYLHHLQFQCPSILGYDGYFHIKLAELLPTIGFTSEFKWAAASVWASGFADKELLFHLFLVPFARLEDPATGLKLATVLLGSAVAASFYLVLSLNRFRLAGLWTLLLFAAGPDFLFRLGSPRPHLLSILLLLWSVHFMINRRRPALAVTVLVYSLSYTAYHLPLMLSLIVGGVGLLTERKLEWRTPLTILAAMVVGTLVNPYFPHNLRLFWLQNFSVLWMSLSGAANLEMAHELQARDVRFLLLSHLALWLPLLGAVALAVRRPRRLSTRSRDLLAIAVTLMMMTLLVGRFIEYSAPLTLFFLASFYSERLGDRKLRAELAAGAPRRVVALAVAGCISLAVAALLWTCYREALPDFREPSGMRREAALYIRDHAEPDELIFSCDWDDTPELFYFNDRNRYLVLLDPSFMYFHDPEAWERWHRVARGGFAARTYEVLAPDYRYGVCTWDFDRLKGIVERDPRMEIVHDTGNTYVFRIDRERPEINLERFLELTPD